MKRTKRHSIPHHHRQHTASKQQAKPAKSRPTGMCKQANLRIPAKKWQAMLANLQHHQAELAMRGVFLNDLPDGTEHTERAERKAKWLLWIFKVSQQSGRGPA